MKNRERGAGLRVAPGDRDLTRSFARAEVRAALEGQLGDWLKPKRWFGGGSRQLTGVRIEGWLPLAEGAGDGSVLCVAAATDADGATTRHPLFLAAGADGAVGEALERPAARARLLELLLGGGEVRGDGLRLVGEPAGPVAGLDRGAEGRLIGAEQSNTSVVYGDRAILKVYRRLESGPNPEVELGRYLSLDAGFAAVPQVYATGRLVGDDGLDAALLILQAFVPDEGDGGEWALAQAGAAFDAAGDETGLDRWLAEHGEVVAAAADLGRTTARLHAALAAATAEDLRPVPAGPADLATWASAVGQEAAATTAAIARAGHDDADLRRAVEAAQVFPPLDAADAGLQTRVHGDYHLGQVIRRKGAGGDGGENAEGWMILDFEGEQARPLPARRRRQHPLVDVAGMVRSWNYAARAASAGRPGAGALADRWEAALRAAFLDAYWAEADAAPAPFLPADTASRLALLRLFELSKALYEVRYELDNRPDMVGIPAAAVKRLMTNAERGTRNAEQGTEE